MAKETPKNTVITTFTPQGDEMITLPVSTLIRAEHYNENLAMEREQIQKYIKTSNRTLLADVISCLDVLKGEGTSELIITIKSDKDNLPSVITKTHVVKKITYPRR